MDEWADRYRFLSQVGSAEPGQWRTSRTPYLREIMRKLTPADPATKVVFAKGSQVGATELANTWIGYIIDYAPGPILSVLPTVDMVKRNNRTRIEPMLEASPRLREKIPPARSRDSGNTQTQKDFPGGTLVMTGANSPSSLSSMPARYLILDEVDRYPGDVEGEGDPVSLSEARTATFARRRKIFMASTPTLEGKSRIWREFLRSDQRYYHVPCPHCGKYDKITFDRLKWEDGKPQTVALVCHGDNGCGGVIEEFQKESMLAAGKWIPDNPEGEFPGFHLSSLYSPLGWYSWEQAVRDWLGAQKNYEALKAYVNTKLGEPWADRGEAPEWENLYRRRESYLIGKIPEKALVLTAGCDVQKDRLEVSVWGWATGAESWLVEHFVLPGDTASSEPWEALDLLMRRDFDHELGGTLQIRRIAVDAGFNTQFVYNWVRQQSPDRAMAIQGRDHLTLLLGTPRPVDVDFGGRKMQQALQLWPVGVSIAKQELYGWLRQPPPLDANDALPYGFMHFPQVDQEYFRQLTAEQMRPRIVGGKTRYMWEKVYDRNESLDCRVYARVAASALGVERWPDSYWQEIESALKLKKLDSPALSGHSEIKRRRSTYL